MSEHVFSFPLVGREPDFCERPLQFLSNFSHAFKPGHLQVPPSLSVFLKKSSFTCCCVSSKQVVLRIRRENYNTSNQQSLKLSFKDTYVDSYFSTAFVRFFCCVLFLLSSPLFMHCMLYVSVSLLFLLISHPCSSSIYIYIYFLSVFVLLYSSNASAPAQEQVSQKPAQTAVVLLNSNEKRWASQSITMTTLCLDSPIKPKNKSVFGAEWLSLLKPSVSLRPHGSMLKFSKSLNDMGQKMDGLCSPHFAERTCSDGELRSDAKGDAECGHQAKTLVVKLTRLPPLYPTQHGSFPTTYGYASAHPADMQKSSNLLRFFFPFPRSSTAGSLPQGELASSAKPSSALLEVNEVFSEEMGDDDVFEEESSGWRLKAKEQHAPLCSLEEDGDLDRCFSPLMEKTGPPSPYSLTGDCCRLVRLLLPTQPNYSRALSIETCSISRIPSSPLPFQKSPEPL